MSDKIYCKLVYKNNIQLEETIQVTNLEEIHDKNYVVSLTCIHNNLRCIKPLKYFKLLEYLDLSYNYIEDLRPISKLENLTYLSLRGNILSNIEPLKNLVNLEELDLVNCRTSINIYYLSKMKNLNRLCCNSNTINHVNCLPMLTSLCYLNLNGCYIHNWDLHMIGKVTSLKYLYLTQNPITDIEPLKDLKLLKELHMSFCRITDISPIYQLKNLSYLNLYRNRITTLSDEILELINLRHLELGGNEIEFNDRQLNFIDWVQRRNIISSNTIIYRDNQNTHDNTVQKSVRDSIKNLMSDGV